MRTLVDTYVDAGEYTVVFDATGLPTGNYFYSLITDEKTLTRQMTLLK